MSPSSPKGTGSSGSGESVTSSRSSILNSSTTTSSSKPNETPMNRKNQDQSTPKVYRTIEEFRREFFPSRIVEREGGPLESVRESFERYLQERADRER